MGHARGLDAMQAIVRTCIEWGIPYSTYYAFSTENWSRPKDEVRYLMGLFVERIPKIAEELRSKGVRLRFIGLREGLDPEVIDRINDAEALPVSGTNTVFIAFNYGSRPEIIQACRKIAHAAQENGIFPDQIDEQAVSDAMFVKGIPDPDLLVRTGGEHRLSNFLLWQCAYTELHFTGTLWPDFGRDGLRKAIEDYGRRDRRYGSIRL